MMESYLVVCYIQDRNNIDPYGHEFFATDAEANYMIDHYWNSDNTDCRLYLITEDYDEGLQIELLRHETTSNVGE